MKVIFLDIDGVLNSHEFFTSERWKERKLEVGPRRSDHRTDHAMIDPVLAERVERVRADTDSRIVVSSSWRHGRTVPQLRWILGQVGIHCVIDATPTSYEKVGTLYSYKERGHEIQAWLDIHPGVRAEDVVILDDDSDMAHLAHRHVKTPFARGIQDEHVEQALALLLRTS